MNNSSNQETLAQIGVDCLTLFGPKHVAAVLAAVSKHGHRLPEVVENRQTRECVMDNVLENWIPMDVDDDTRMSLLRSLSVIIVDSLTDRWDAEDYKEIIVEVLGTEPQQAEQMVKDVVTDYDWAVTRWIREGYMDFMFVDELAHWAVKGLDDYIDEALGQIGNDNLFEMVRFGRAIKEAALQAKLIKYQLSAMKREVGDNDLNPGGALSGALKRWLPSDYLDMPSSGQVIGALTQLKSLVDGMDEGLLAPSEDGDPTDAYLASLRDPAGESALLRDMINETLQANLSRVGAEYDARPETGGFLTSLAIGGAAKGIGSLIKKARSSGSAKKAMSKIASAGGIGNIADAARAFVSARSGGASDRPGGTVSEILSKAAARGGASAPQRAADVRIEIHNAMAKPR